MQILILLEIQTLKMKIKLSQKIQKFWEKELIMIILLM